MTASTQTSADATRDAVMTVLRESRVPLDAYKVGRIAGIAPMLAGRTLWELVDANVAESLSERGTLNDLAALFRLPENAVSRRGTLVSHGVVNFPFDDSRYEHSGEGGMFVKLVVIDPSDPSSSDWAICVGVGVLDLKEASLVGDDRAELPVLGPLGEDTPEQTLKALDANNEAHKSWESRHFPMLHEEGIDNPFEQFLSRPYLASMVLGNTGWTGLSVRTSEYWVCRYENLSEQGKAVYDQMQALYPTCRLHLLTFLDT